jgi:DNA-binding response OmpR family regulator
MDGHEVLGALRASAATASLSVVFLTGETTLKELETLIQAGARRVFQKPFDPKTLVHELRLLMCPAIAKGV